MGTKTNSIFSKSEQVKIAYQTRRIQMRAQSIEVAMALRSDTKQGVDEVLRDAAKVFAYAMNGKVPAQQKGDNIVPLQGRSV